MDRFICIHGHFYQPPRENAWLEEIEIQDSAHPYHDWNERVSAESYAPNSASRILDIEDRIIDIVNNYARISFDAGPTLLTWMEKFSPDVYQAILQADRESRGRFHGHGSAIAQAYNHIIMPLANSRDKRTQILWGLRDFESRFGRAAEGLWLPETAVDLETLDLAAEQGILFTILSPFQAAQVRKQAAREWTDVSLGRIDPKKPYLCRLPSGRAIALFFYDGPIAHDVAFGDVLRNGEGFAKRLMAAFAPDGAGPALVHIATDGETYGHHHRFGDMALAYCLYFLESHKLADLTVYGDYLERFPPVEEVKIFENTAWSCAHGVERWRSDCGDNSGANPRWNQKWRAPLREAMEWLRDKAAPIFEQGMKDFADEPWAVRDDYIHVILDRSPQNIEAFFTSHARRPLSPGDKVKFLKLCEIQRHAMLIFTSDGWFFDDISNVETVQVIQYAARAMQLARDVSGEELEPGFLKRLEKAQSNLPEQGNGGRIFDRLVRPAIVDFPRLAAHYAVSSLFEEYPQAFKIAHYEASADVCERAVIGKRKMAVGKVTLKSEITWEQRTMSYAVLHLGDQNLTAGVKEHEDEKRFQAMCKSIMEAFTRSDMTSALRLIDQGFGTHSFSLWHLFKDERRKVLNQILEDNLRSLEAVFRQVFESNYALMQALIELQIPLPEALSTPAEFVLNADFRSVMTRDVIDFGRLQGLMEEYTIWSFKPDAAAAGYIVSKKINAMMASWVEHPENLSDLATIERLLSVLRPLGMDLDLWRSQNIYFLIGKSIYAATKRRAEKGDASARDWLSLFDSVGRELRVDPVVFLSK